MSLFFGGTSTPPISPHVAPRSTLHFPFQSSGPSSSGPLQRMAGGGLRPTRRDLLLCIITLSLSYLFFNRGGPPEATTSISRSNIGAQHPASGLGDHLDVPGGSGFRSPLGSFSSVPAQVKCPPGVQVLKYETFTEAAETRGFDGVAIAKAAGEATVAPIDWDDIEDERVQDMMTVKVAHQPGWTLAEKFYLYNGSIYVVTTSRGDWPELTHMISTGLPANGDPGNMEARLPKGHELIFITPREAANLWGPRVYKMSGMTYLWNDGQFIDHYYHYAAELLLGTWRVHASLDPSIGPDGRTSMPGPQRAWFIHQGIDEW